VCQAGGLYDITKETNTKSEKDCIIDNNMLVVLLCKSG
jgi:hypothetical protein